MTGRSYPSVMFFALKIIDYPPGAGYSRRSMHAIDYADLSEKVYRSIREMILTGEIAPGEKLRQEELASKLGISRTPLAAAFSKLEKEMLVELLPRRGARVRMLGHTQLLDLYDIRIRLESLGAAAAASNATPGNVGRLEDSLERYRGCVESGDATRIRISDYEFHLAIAEISGNEALYRIISSFNIVFICNQGGLLKPAHRSLEEHERLLGAIRARDGGEAERIMSQHLLDARNRLKASGGDGSAVSAKEFP